MTPEQTIDLLDLAASIDGREVGRSDVAAWHLVIGDLDFADAQQAMVAHYQEDRRRVMPADIRQRVKAYRRTRLAHAPIPAPPAELTVCGGECEADCGGRCRTREYQAELSRSIDAVGSGRDVGRPALHLVDRKAELDARIADTATKLAIEGGRA